MNNFIVGQITPDMLKHMKWGTYVFFGLLTAAGGLFVWLGVPETKRLTLEEMDILFGSKGVAEAVSLSLLLHTNSLLGGAHDLSLCNRMLAAWKIYGRKLGSSKRLVTELSGKRATLPTGSKRRCTYPST